MPGAGAPFISGTNVANQLMTITAKRKAGNIQRNTGNPQVTNTIELAEYQRDLEATRKDAAAYQHAIALL